MNKMQFHQTQYIRFPSVTKLQYLGKTLEEPNFINNKHNIKRGSSQSVVKPFYIIEKQSQVVPNRFELVSIPKNSDIMTITTMNFAKNIINTKRNSLTDYKNERNEQKQKKTIQKISTNKVRSMTQINFSFKRKIQHIRPINTNSVDIYSQTIVLFALVNQVIINKKGITNKIRKAKVEKGNNDLLVRQIIKNRNSWTCLGRKNQQEYSLKNGISNSINLHWTETYSSKAADECSQLSSKNLKSIFEIDSSEILLGYPFQKNFEKSLAIFPKIIQLFFTQWQQQPSKLQDYLQKIVAQAKYFVNPENIIIYNHLYQHREMTNKKNLYYNLSSFYDKKYMNVFEKIPTTYHLTAFNWQAVLSSIKKHSKSKSWIVKPGQNSNQGRGIRVFSSTKDAVDFILLYPPKTQEKTLLVQEYIKPFLYEGRKFDIRCYILALQVQKSIKFFWYEQGYIRTATEKFTLKKVHKSIHLTNDAVQKHLQNYGQKQTANKLSYNQLQKYLYDNAGLNFMQTILPQMREVARDLAQSVSNKIGKKKGINFQIFGLDYLIDEAGKSWLIEVNTNPSYDLCNSLLSRIIPQMLENTMRLILDVFIPSLKNPDWVQQFLMSNKYKLIYSKYRQD